MRLGGIVMSVIVAAVVGFAAYGWQSRKAGGVAGGGSPTAIVDTVAVKTDLLSIANAMKQQFALEARYVSLAELRARGVPVPERRGPYVYSADVTDMTFTIKATYEVKEGEQARPTLTIGPDMLVKDAKAP